MIDPNIDINSEIQLNPEIIKQFAKLNVSEQCDSDDTKKNIETTPTKNPVSDIRLSSVKNVDKIESLKKTAKTESSILSRYDFGHRSLGSNFIRSFSTTNIKNKNSKLKKQTTSFTEYDARKSENKNSFVQSRIETFQNKISRQEIDGIVQRKLTEKHGAISKTSDVPDTAIPYRKRTNSYIMAMQSDDFRKLKLFSNQKTNDSKESVVSKTVSKFENNSTIDIDLQRKQYKNDLQNSIDNIIQEYSKHRKSGTLPKNKYKDYLKLEIDNALLSKHEKTKKKSSSLSKLKSSKNKNKSRENITKSCNLLNKNSEINNEVEDQLVIIYHKNEENKKHENDNIVPDEEIVSNNYSINDTNTLNIGKQNIQKFTTNNKDNNNIEDISSVTLIYQQENTNKIEQNVCENTTTIEPHYTTGTSYSKPDYLIIMCDKTTINKNNTDGDSSLNENPNCTELQTRKESITKLSVKNDVHRETNKSIHDIATEVETLAIKINNINEEEDDSVFINSGSSNLSKSKSEVNVTNLSEKFIEFVRAISLDTSETPTKNRIKNIHTKSEAEKDRQPSKNLTNKISVLSKEQQSAPDNQEKKKEEDRSMTAETSVLAPPKIRRTSRLYSGKFKRSTSKPSTSQFNKEDINNNAGAQYFYFNDTDKTNDNQSITEYEATVKFQSEIIFHDEQNDNDNIITETYNTYIPKHYCTTEWVHNAKVRLPKEKKEILEINMQINNGDRENDEFQSDDNSNTSLNEDIYENVTHTINSEGIHSLIYHDEDNNPIIRVESMQDLSDFDVRTSKEEQKICELEKEFRKNINDIVNNTQKQCLIKELIDTEKSYIEISLHRLVMDYMPEMNNSDLPPGLEGRLRNIFGNVDFIYDCHKNKFFPDLQICNTTEEIGNCFLKHESIFKLYPLYAKNKPRSNIILREYKSFFKIKQEELGDPLDLASYLLTPIQRLAKYCLLMQNLVRECEKEREDCNLLKSATEMLQKQMNIGNDLIAIDSIHNCDINIKEQGDLLLRDPFIIIQPHNKKSAFEGMVFLFQESLIITQILRQNSAEYFIYKDCMKMSELGYTEMVQELKQFEVWFRKREHKMYLFRTKDPNIKNKWIRELFALLWKQLEASKKSKNMELEQYGIKPTRVPVTPKPYSIPNSIPKKSDSSMSSVTSGAIWYS